MTSKRLLLGAAVVAALGLAAVPASAAHRGAGGHGGPAIHRAGGIGAHFAGRGRIGAVGYSRGFRGLDRGRSAHAQIGWRGGWGRGGWGWGRGWGWGGGWGLGAGIGLGLAAASWSGGWGYPGYYYDTGYYDTAPAFDVAPGFVSVGFGPTWGRTWGWGGPWW